ncbi:hypothetical protein OG339_30465 [Streptosporangium sp. NBC_01495]|uniref:hypothetical protein n=1 Tax=Streptosporangium sp. NBC_01495 TaxID=2903899 RepID=UPI002E37A8D2|nr:hypothetical protein [Streptosporangium sp. NBC_01495]
MSDIDDIDERFKALTAQINERERKRMSKAIAQERVRHPRLRRRRRLRNTAIVVAVLVAAAGVFVIYRPDVVDRVRTTVSDRLSGPATGETTETAEPAETAREEPVEVSPFVGSPAQKYADGAKGLVMPRPRAMGGLNRKEVSAALGHARKLLMASHLDRKVLMGGRPEKLIRLLDPEQRAPFVKGLKKPDKKKGYYSREWVTSLAPKSAELVSETFKVHGRPRLSAFRENGLRGVRVKVNYLFVYAIRRPGRPDTLTRLVAHNIGTLDAWREGGRLRFWVTHWNGGGVAPARCDIDDGFVHPFYPDSAPDRKLTADGPAVDPYSLDEGTSEGCRVLKSDT